MRMSDKEVFEKELNECIAKIEKLIETYPLEETGHQEITLEVMNYSIGADGKRLRLILMQEMYRLFTGCLLKPVIPLVAAAEMIHTSLLVHDDLPCMDDDMVCRGKVSTWAESGEGIDVLAGDALTMYIFKMAFCASETSMNSDEPSRVRKAIRTPA